MRTNGGWNGGGKGGVDKGSDEIDFESGAGVDGAVDLIIKF